MKNSIFSRIKIALIAALASVGSFVAEVFKAPPGSLQPSGRMSGPALKQGGFVLLGKPYAGYAQGTIVELPASTEAALIASGQATNSAGPPTAGAVTTTANSGCVTFAAAAASLVVTNPNVSKQSMVVAYVNQAAADGTMLDIVRIVCVDGSFTLHANAAATAATLVKWAIINPNGSLSNPQ